MSVGTPVRSTGSVLPPKSQKNLNSPVVPVVLSWYPTLGLLVSLLDHIQLYSVHSLTLIQQETEMSSVLKSIKPQSIKSSVPSNTPLYLDSTA